MVKRWDKTSCGGCKKLFAAENLIADFKSSSYLCDGCYIPEKETEMKKMLVDEENDENNGEIFIK